VSYWLGNEHKLPQGRLTFASYVIVCLTLLLLSGFWKFQILESEYYAQLAERNRIRSIPIIAPRGQMLDREGRVLVDNWKLEDALKEAEKMGLSNAKTKEFALDYIARHAKKQ